MSPDINQHKVEGASRLEATPILTKLILVNTAHQLDAVRLIHAFQGFTAQVKLMSVCLSRLSHQRDRNSQ